MVSEIIGLLRDILFILNIIFAIIVVFYERKEPAVTWAWLMVILILPYFGFILYLFLGLDSRKHGVFAQKATEDKLLYKEYLNMDINSMDFLNEQIGYIKSKNILKIKGSAHFNDMLYLNFISGDGAYYENNQLQSYHDGGSKFEAFLADIQKAKHFIHIQYYIVHNDELGKRIIQALAEKAAQGVEVKFLVDGMGCSGTPRRFYKPLKEAGGKVAIFLPPHFIRLNFRNHRKLAVIDGTIGYVGGLNIGDEYLGKVKKFGHWRDCHIRIAGNAVRQLELRFIMDWNFCQGQKNAGKHPERLPLDKQYFPKTPKITDGVGMQIVSSGPDTQWPNIQYAYAKMITEADKSIYIQTPYFVPDDSIFEALRIAALSGIDVRVMIPAHPDHPFVYWAGLSYLGELLEVGVKCYEYEKGFVHSKLLIVDGLVASVGTANMDVRSFKLNFEVNAFIYDQATVNELEAQFIKDLDDSREIASEWYNRRSGITKIKESVSRLLSPML